MMLFDDTFAPQDDEEERRRRVLMGAMPDQGDSMANAKAAIMAARDASPGIVAAAQPQDDAVAKAKSIIAGLGLSDQLPGFGQSLGGTTWQPPLNSMKPDAIVPLPTTPMPGASTDVFRPPLNSMKPGAIVPLPSADIAESATQERQPLWANDMGPAAPGQRVSYWKNYGNGVMINDGTTGRPSLPLDAAPGAGYTSQGVGGIKPIAAPGDMDWGNRVAQEPYTNPLIQGMIRDHQMQMERQRQVLDNHLLIAQENNLNRNLRDVDQERNKGLAISGNPKIAPEIRKGAIENLKVPEQEKAPMRIEVDLTTTDKSGHPQAIGVGKDGSFQEIMTRAGSHDPDALRSYLESQRGVSPQVAVQRLNILRNKSQDGGLGSIFGVEPLTKQEKAEWKFIEKLYGKDVQLQKPGWFQGDYGPQFELK